jgi:hypothetical protein
MKKINNGFKRPLLIGGAASAQKSSFEEYT